MREYVSQVKKLCDGLSKSQMEDVVRDLVEEFSAFDLSPEAWKEVYLAVLKRLPELNERWKLLAVIYRAVSVRADYVVAGRVVYRILKRFDVLFEKLPGRPSYFVPTPEGMRLFETLIEPEKREEVHREAKVQSTVVQQLSLLSYLERFPSGVRA